MDAHDYPFERIHVFRDAQMKSLSAEPFAFRILQMMGSEESILPNIWALGGILMALVATVASIITGARMIRLRLQENKAEEEEFFNNELTILPTVCNNESNDEDEGIEFSRCSSSSSSYLFPSQATMMKRKKNNEQDMGWGLHNQMDLFITREAENWGTEMDYGMEVWDCDKKKRNCFWPEFSVLDERIPVPALFRPLLESFSKIEEYSEFEREEILNMNFKNAWELGKSKFRQWQLENLPPYNSLFGKEDVVKLWDNLKGRALRTFYVQQGGFASALSLDSRWMSGIASLSNTSESQGLVSVWDVDEAASPTPTRISGNMGEIEGVYMESSNTIITATGGKPAPDGGYGSGRAALKLWDTRMRMGPRPAAVALSIHELLRMVAVGGGPFTTFTLQQVHTKVRRGHHNNLLSNSCFAEETEETEELRTWWDEDAVLVVNEEEEEEEEEEKSDEAEEHDIINNNSGVVSWWLGAVRSLSSSSMGKTRGD